MKMKLFLLLKDASAFSGELLNTLKWRYASQDTFKHSLDGAVKGKQAISPLCIYEWIKQIHVN